MKLYLIQHGQATSKEENPERPLNGVGVQDITQLAGLLKKASVQPAKIIHSDKLRALQTAQQLQQILDDSIPLEWSDKIKPKSSVAEIMPLLESSNDDLAVVSHLPFVNNLTAFLLCGNEEEVEFNFIPGSIVCLEREEQKRWSLNWMIRPDILID